jgi:hypothetical protein
MNEYLQELCHLYNDWKPKNVSPNVGKLFKNTIVQNVFYEKYQ